jgi:beta-lactamase class A
VPFSVFFVKLFRCVAVVFALCTFVASAHAQTSEPMQTPSETRSTTPQSASAASRGVIPPSSSTIELQKRVGAMAAAHHGKVALFAKNLTTGETVAVDPDTPVQTASVIKLPLMLQAYEQVRDGKLRLEQHTQLSKENIVGGSGILYLLDPGLPLTLKDVISLMMTLSDNTATNMTIDMVGLAPTNEMLARMGMKNTYFYKKVFKPAEGPMPDDQKKFGLGKTTAAEMAAIMESIYRCQMGSRDLCTQMMTIMRNQQDRDMLPRYLPRHNEEEGLYATADKIGALDDVRNDVALVWTVRGPVVISIFTYDNEDQSWTPDNAAEVLIGRLAEAIVQVWSPEGLAPKVENVIAPLLPADAPGAVHAPAPATTPPAPPSGAQDK